MPSARAAACAATAAWGDGIGIDSTAPSGVTTPSASASVRTRSRTRSDSSGRARSTRSAASARGRRRRGQGGVEDERPRPVDQVLAQRRRAEHRAALAAERLGQGRGDDDVGVAGEPGPRHQARAVDAEAVRLVDHEQSVVRRAQLGQLRQRSRVAEDRVDGLGQHQRALGRRRARSCRAARPHRVDVAVRDDGEPGAGQPGGVDQRGVDVGVGDDVRRAVGQGGDHGEVGGVAGRQHQRARAARGSRRARPRARRGGRGCR